MSHPQILAAPAGTLESELAGALLFMRFGDRQASAVAARLGWDGRGPSTLNEAAISTGYTRERVRQLESRVRRDADATHRLPTLDRALATVESCAPDSSAQIALTLFERGISGAPFDPAGILTAADVFGRRTSLSTRRGLVAATDAPDPTRAILETARRLVAARGAVSVVELARLSGVEPGRARRLLGLAPEVVWLDDQRSWVGLRVPNTRRRMEGILRKMLAVGRQLTLVDADEGLRRSYRPVVLPPPILCRLYEGLQWLDVDLKRGTLSSDRTFDERELSPIERQLSALFIDHGPTLNFTQAVRLGKKVGLNHNTVGYYLSRAPIIKTLARGTYALRGVEAYELQAA
ncbi:MAG TPA: hypothetical protein VHV52_08810 [Gaiellaceae bacterium]|jgi:hypothetical protein|nr:hypothetical protein [Gaiellaceae bacterium]